MAFPNSLIPIHRSLLKYRKDVNSANGEDGVVAEICRRLDIHKGWFCEFGAWDGKHLSNTYELLENHGWQGVMIEGDEKRFQDLEATARRFQPRLHALRAWVSHRPNEKDSSLDALLAKTPIPENFDLLSVDIDSYDYQVWESLKNYHPKIVIIEINGRIHPDARVIHEEGGEGTSFAPMLELGESKGYKLICHTGNMIFVKNELVQKLGLPKRELNNPRSLFVWEWVNLGTLGRIKRRFSRIFSHGYQNDMWF